MLVDGDHELDKVDYLD